MARSHCDELLELVVEKYLRFSLEDLRQVVGVSIGSHE